MAMRTPRYLVGLIAFFMVTIVQASPVMVRNLRTSTLSHRVRLVFDLSRNPKYHVFVLNSPPRIVLDLAHSKLLTKILKPHRLGWLVKNIRTAKRVDGLRIVLDLNKSVNYKAFVLHNKKRGTHRLVLDLIAGKKKYSRYLMKPVIKTPRYSRLRKVIVVIDPGHGGKDSGAIGSRGTYEKNVVLGISKYLQQMINRQYGFSAKLTRTGDYFIPLRGRLAIERKEHADMFIAIHADAYKNRAARGASVFALSEHGATTEAARWLARRENESELGHTLADLQYKNKVLRSVLINLAQTASISTGLQVGEDIMHQLAKVTKLHHGFVEQAAFVVLKEPDIPSLLVETGFISNPREELLLRNRICQQKLARAIMFGVKKYFILHPPMGTYLAKRRHYAH